MKEQIDKNIIIRDGKKYYHGSTNCYFCRTTMHCELPEGYMEAYINLRCGSCGSLHDYLVGNIKARYKRKPKIEKLNQTKIK